MTSRSVSSTRLSGAAMRATLTPTHVRTAPPQLRRPTDRGRADDAIAVVQDDGLTRRNSAGGVMQTHDELTVLDVSGARQWHAVRPQLREAVERQRRLGGAPRRRTGDHGLDVQQLGR